MENVHDFFIPIVFPDYRIRAHGFLFDDLGHAGLLYIDGETGLTRYFDYGRYDAQNYGEVKKRDIPDVRIGDDGNITPESFENVMSEIAIKAGYGDKTGRLVGSIYQVSDGSFEVLDEAYLGNGTDVPGYINVPPEYDLQENNCYTFIREQGELVDVFMDAHDGDSFDYVPTNAMEEVLESRGGFIFDPKDKSLTEVQKDTEVELETRCFAAGTKILIGIDAFALIDGIGVGDHVMAFQSEGESSTEPRRVTAIHTREVEETLDFHGTIVTPEHVFLSGDGSFKKLADILEEDGTVVLEDGTVVRARTKCPVGSEDDRVVPIRYTDPETRKTETATIRAGAPFAADGEEVVTVAEAMRKIGYELGADGLFVDIDGNRVMAQWPWGRPEPTNLAENRVSFV